MAAMERGGSGGATASMSRDQCVDVLACLSPASRSCQLGAGRSPGPDGAGAKGGRGEGRRRRLQRVLEPPWAAASRAGSSIRLLETGDGDSPVPASAAGGRARPRLEGGGGEGGGGGDACRRLRRASDLPRAACWRAGRTRAQRRDFSFVAHDSPTSQTCFSLAAALSPPPDTHALLPPSPAPPAAAAVPPRPAFDAVLTTET